MNSDFMKADALRDKFLEFFRSKGHRVLESDSLVPKDDPTVLFTPAGMNQFKKQFLGIITDFTRAATSQRCLRTDDLDKVGKTSAHHTMFEMLGNFSFGDYFKEDAIAWAWEFLTKELKIAPERLWVSVYKDDDEAYLIWRNKIQFPTEKIVKLGDKDNFWPSEAKQKGPNGPCGPCSEIFIDMGKQVSCTNAGCDPSCSCGRFVEVWNLVFTQFNRKEDGSLEPLPRKNIDTGMGLERLTALMQGARNNFETDLFQPIIQAVLAESKADKHDPRDAYAIADHIRAVTFAIYDGVLPSNEARGYVVRKLIRKSVLHLRAFGIKHVFLYKLVSVVADIMKKPYPELTGRRENIAEIVLAEEKSFLSTLDSSPELLQEKFSGLLETPDPIKAGAIAFQLYDTYGIPLELTRDWLKKHKLEMSQESFEQELEQQKSRSKSSSQMKGDVFSVKEAQFKGIKPTIFLGYREIASEAKVIKVFSAGDFQGVILDQTPFYAESGGQVGDTGVIESQDAKFLVNNTRKADGVFIHEGSFAHGNFSEGQTVQAGVDNQRRTAIDRNHTATHLLQAALRQVLGPHVQQQGSLVDQQRLRFDFTHFRDLKKDELERIEDLVNSNVLADHPVNKQEMSLQEAKAQGALAFFAEKYEQKVRVISIEGISKELCGGTHLDNTAAIGLFEIYQESSVASGVRRIEARTGFEALKNIRRQRDVLSDLCEELKSPEEKASGELKKKLQLIKELEKSIIQQKIDIFRKEIKSSIAGLSPEEMDKPLVRNVGNADPNMLRQYADIYKEQAKYPVVVLGSTFENKAYIVAASNKGGIAVNTLIKEVSPIIGGSGGGRPDFVQAGGTKPEKLEEALKRFKELLEKL